MGGDITAWRCGVCRKELRGIWAVLRGRQFPVCSKCRLMIHHECLAQENPALCRRCAASQVKSPAG
jgi:hypothetical protein